VQWYRDGGFIGQHSDQDDLRVRAGDVVVFDMARTQQTVAQGSRVLSLIVPRALGDEAFAGGANPHGTVLRSDSIFGGLLADHLNALHRRLPSIGMDQADDVVRATTHMLAACIRPSQRTLADILATRSLPRRCVAPSVFRATASISCLSLWGAWRATCSSVASSVHSRCCPTRRTGICACLT
jgi:hypothetical protein